MTTPAFGSISTSTSNAATADLRKLFSDCRSLDNNISAAAFARLKEVTRSLSVLDRTSVVKAGLFDVLLHGLCDGPLNQRADAAWALANLIYDPSYEYAEGDVARDSARALTPHLTTKLLPLISVQNDACQQAAARTLWVLADCRRVSKIMMQAGAIPALVGLLASGSEASKSKAAGALASLAYDTHVRPEIVRAGGIMGLAHLLASGRGDAGPFNAVFLLGNLLREESREERGTGYISLRQRCLQVLESGCVGPLVQLLSHGDNKVAAKVTQIIFTMSQQDEAVDSLWDNGAPHFLTQIARGTAAPKAAHSSAFLALAMLVGAEENGDWVGDSNLLSTVIEAIRCGLNGSAVDGVEYPLWMACHAAQQVCGNNRNVQTLRELNIFEPLFTVIKRAYTGGGHSVGPVIDDATKYALGALCALCFNDDARAQLVKSDATQFVDRIAALRDPLVARECAGILWHVGGLADPAPIISNKDVGHAALSPLSTHSATLSPRSPPPAVPRSRSPTTVLVTSGGGDNGPLDNSVNVGGVASVMSPQRVDLPSCCLLAHPSHRELSSRIGRALAANGVRVREPVAQLDGGRATWVHAVQQSEVAIISLSRLFEHSLHCRLDAVYAAAVNRRLLFLKFQTAYLPKSWLARLLRNQTAVDFTAATDFNVSSESLVAQLTRGAGTIGSPTSVIPDGNHPSISNAALVSGAASCSSMDEPLSLSARLASSANICAIQGSGALSWSVEQVGNWLQSVALGEHRQTFASQGVDGKALLELSSLEQRNPQFFHSSLKAELSVARFGDRLLLAAALKELSSAERAAEQRKKPVMREYV